MSEDKSKACDTYMKAIEAMQRQKAEIAKSMFKLCEDLEANIVKAQADLARLLKS